MAKTAKRKTNAPATGLEALLSNLSNMLEQNTKVLNTIVSRISGKRTSRSTVEVDSQNVGERTHRTHFNANQMLLDALKQIGSPSSSSEIAARLIKSNPEMRKLSKQIGKERFTQYIYTSTSNLTKDGTLFRRPIPGYKRLFNYGLKEWDKAPKTTRKTAKK